MGKYSDTTNDGIMEDTIAGQTVAAASGHFVVDYGDDDLEPVLAWRVGNSLVLPITRYGLQQGECWIVGPDGVVRHHGYRGPSIVPSFETVAAWRAHEDQMRMHARVNKNRPFDFSKA
jgi:hypothetical protein